MRGYLYLTAVIFGGLVVAHLWRASVEGWYLFRRPDFLIVTILCAVAAGWAVALLRRRRHHDPLPHPDQEP